MIPALLKFKPSRIRSDRRAARRLRPTPAWFRFGPAITTEPTLTRSNPDELVNLQVIGARTTGGGTPLYDVTPDGERLLWSIPEDVAAVEEDGETPRINIVLNWFEELKDRLPVD